jgi:hypothetical protein
MKLPTALAEGPPAGECRIRRVTNAHSTEPCAPQSGRFAAASLWVEALPPDCDLNGLEVRFRGVAGTPTYIGPPEHDGLVQVNALLPPNLPTGMAPVELVWRGEPLAPAAYLRILPAPALAPHVVSVRDGVDLLGGATITSGMIKVTVEEVVEIAQFSVAFDGAPIGRWEHFLIDPRLPAWEVNFAVPEGAAEGPHMVECRYRGRPFAPLPVRTGG